VWSIPEYPRSGLADLDGTLAFFAGDPEEGPGLFLLESDGKLVERALGAATPRGEVAHSFSMDGTLYWSDGVPTSAFPHRRETVWRFDPRGGDVTSLGEYGYIHEVLVSASRFFFVEVGALENRLLISDGTVAGTYPLSQIEEVAVHSPYLLAETAGGVVFAVDSADRGSELAFTDGTPEGTLFLPEINPGPAGSHPTEVEVWGDRVYVSAFRPDVGHELFAFDRALLARPCVDSEISACLQGGRFEIRVEWTDPATQAVEPAGIAHTTSDTAVFWFFEPGNLEVEVKVLDGRALNGYYWVYGGGLTDLRVRVTVRDLATGEAHVFHRAAGEDCGFAEIEAFRDPAGPAAPANASSPPGHGAQRSRRSPGVEPCAGALCLHDERFRIEAEWRDGASSSSGSGIAIPATEQSGHFWFFEPDNLELTVKLLDGRAINGAWWLFHAPLTDLPYTLRVLDTHTGAEREVASPGGTLCGGLDLELFIESPLWIP
jgi:ELWxxDGT repeat protein